MESGSLALSMCHPNSSIYSARWKILKSALVLLKQISVDWGFPITYNSGILFTPSIMNFYVSFIFRTASINPDSPSVIKLAHALARGPPPLDPIKVGDTYKPPGHSV